MKQKFRYDEYFMKSGEEMQAVGVLATVTSLRASILIYMPREAYISGNAFSQ